MFVKIILFITAIENVFCQVCVDTKMSWRDVPETYTYTYMEAYEKTNCLFWCTDTRVATAVGTRTVWKQVAEKINVCCNGYVVEEKSYNDTSLHCKPVCSPPCVNGYCKSPGVCSCHDGYLPDIFERHTCIPICLKGCDHGTCSAPNTCECHTGYELVEDICEPICEDPCEYGTCVAPDTCQCLPGYKKSADGICEYYCSSYTADYECIDTITCEPGWVKVTKGTLETCEPVCNKACIQGTCVAPDTCECLHGYLMSTLNTCEPYCESGCPNGSCVSPENCVCDLGWFKKEESGACLAHCDHACGNGTCVAPNVCECFPGFVLDESRISEEHNGPVCVPICENCEAPCASIEDCTCPILHEPVHLTAAGGNCSISEDKCDRMLCYMTTTTMNPNEVAIGTNTESTNLEWIAVNAVDYETTSIKEDHHNEFKVDKASWFNSSWFYGIGSLFLATVLIVMIVGVLKKKYSRLFQRNIFSPKGHDVSTVVHYKQTTVS